MKNYIQNQQTKLKRKRINNIDVFLKDEVKNFDPFKVIRKAIKSVPEHLSRYIDTIYIGQFDHLDNRSLNASYLDGMIFLTNEQKDENDMLDDIIHEIAHSIEDSHGDEIYGDLTLQREFILKRKKLYVLLEQEGFEVKNYSFEDPNYNVAFDEFLHKEVTYGLLRSLTTDLFYSPYAATSLREYFANGFEAVFYDRDSNKLGDISPILLEKIKNLV